MQHIALISEKKVRRESIGLSHVLKNWGTLHVKYMLFFTSHELRKQLMNPAINSNQSTISSISVTCCAYDPYRSLTNIILILFCTNKHGIGIGAKR